LAAICLAGWLVGWLAGWLAACLPATHMRVWQICHCLSDVHVKTLLCSASDVLCSVAHLQVVEVCLYLLSTVSQSPEHMELILQPDVLAAVLASHATHHHDTGVATAFSVIIEVGW